MEKDIIKSDSTYNKMNYFMGILLLAFIIFLGSYFFFSYRNNKTAKLQQKENIIVATSDITNLKVTTIG